MRSAGLSSPLTQTPGKNTLVDARAVARVESWRTHNGKTEHKVRNFVLSRKVPADELLETVRAHWSIENKLH